MASSKSISNKNKKTSKKNGLKDKVQLKISYNANTLAGTSEQQIPSYINYGQKSFDYLVVYDFEEL